MERERGYVASNGDRTSGIYSLVIETGDENLDIRQVDETQLNDNPSFLAVHPTETYLYAVHEVDTGAVTALARSDDGSLNRVNREESGGAGPCYCSVHPSGEYLFVAHYQDGTVSVLPIREDGGVEPPSDVVSHTGSSVHPERQTQPHPHSIQAGPDGRGVYVADLGTDSVVVYELEDSALERIGSTPIHDGAGPRHLAFHPSGDLGYLINELDSTVTVLERDAETGGLDPLSTYSTLPDGTDVENYPADIHLRPGGAYLYGSNRGHDSIAVFAVGADGRELTSVSHVGANGEWPRDFALDVTGRALFAENQHSDAITIFRIDEETGNLSPADRVLDIPSPACMKVLPADDSGA